MMHREEHEQLQKLAREFLERECPTAHVRAMIEDERRYSPDLWRKMANLGWTGAVIPEEYGGTGLDFIALAILLEEMGRALLPAPFLATTVLGCHPIIDAGSEPLKRDLLPRVANGSVILSGAYYEPDSWYDPLAVRAVATRTSDGYRLDGVKLFVPWADAAEFIVTSATLDGEPGLFVVPTTASGVRVTRIDTMNWHPSAELVLEGVTVPAEAAILPEATADLIGRTIRQAMAGVCALQVGGAARALEMTVEYAKTRVAFGRPIGAFQAIKHRLADLAVEVTAARALAAKAARAVADRTADEVEAIAMAKAWCSDTYRHVTNEALQLHGGIGFTWEHDIHLYMRAAQAYAVMLGDADGCRDVVAARKFEVEAVASV
jgi:alkylation response protein AidB-like acyl-CoA dehydrogenase